MNRQFLVLFLVLIFSKSICQNTEGEDISLKVKSFDYKCLGFNGDKGIKYTKLKIIEFELIRSTIILNFKITTNCSNTQRGQLLVSGDTLKIFDQLEKYDYKETKTTDSLGNEITSFSYSMASPTECDCLANYSYKIKDVKALPKILCYHQAFPANGKEYWECVELKVTK
ncbi:MAG: hypothetical protein ACOVMQ_03435 [Cyclobacteriaceae bacterium]|jgi:hypothetical protein